MIPPLIVEQALRRGIRLIAIADHNASANVEAVQQAAHDTDLTVLAGMELQTREEVHVLCLFDRLDQLRVWQREVDDRLPARENDVDLFGEQFVVDATGAFVRREPRLLIASADVTLDDAVGRVSALGGLAIPAHVSKKAFSLIANLGLVPTDVQWEALEISRHVSPDEVRGQFPSIGSLPLIRGGDAHYLDDILGWNELTLAAPTIAEIKKALRGEDGRALRMLGD